MTADKPKPSEAPPPMLFGPFHGHAPTGECLIYSVWQVIGTNGRSYQVSFSMEGSEADLLMRSEEALQKASEIAAHHATAPHGCTCYICVVLFDQVEEQKGKKVQPS